MKPSRYSRRRNSVVRRYKSASARVSWTSGWRGRRGGRSRSRATLERRVRIITACVSARLAVIARHEVLALELLPGAELTGPQQRDEVVQLPQVVLKRRGREQQDE